MGWPGTKCATFAPKASRAAATTSCLVLPASVTQVPGPRFAAIAAKLPWILLMPVLLVAMPLSGIAGLLYAVQYNRHGGRQRLFGDKAEKKQLAAKSK